jgi:hypothetical protein
MRKRFALSGTYLARPAGLALTGALLVALLMSFLLVAGPVKAQTTPDDHTTPAPTENHTQTAVPTLPVNAQTAGQIIEGLDPAEITQLKALRGNELTPEQVTQLKALTVQKIKQYGPSLIDKLEEKNLQKQGTRLTWIALIIVITIPVLAFIGFLLYPIFRRKKIQEVAPGTSMKRVYGLYLPQAILVTLVLFFLGLALMGIQFLLGYTLGGVTNPQLVLQRESIQYVIDESDQLVDKYTDLMVGLADDINEGDPDRPIFEIILQNAQQLKDDPVVNTAISIVQFVMPFLTYVALVSFCLLLLFFLIRIRPDIMLLLKYPIDILEAEHKGTPLPAYISASVGTVTAAATPNATTRQIGRMLMWVEVKVIALFAVGILVVAFIMSLALNFFFLPIIGILVDTINDAAEFFLYTEGSSNTLVLATSILMVFVVECILLFLLAFILGLIRLQNVLRLRFGQQITWNQAITYMRKVGLRFLWVMVLLSILGMGIPFLVEKIDDVLYSGGNDPDLPLILLAAPVILVVVLNLGMWLGRGFKTLMGLILGSAAKELGLNQKDTPPAPVSTTPKIAQG